MILLPIRSGGEVLKVRGEKRVFTDPIVRGADRRTSLQVQLAPQLAAHFWQPFFNKFRYDPQNAHILTETQKLSQRGLPLGGTCCLSSTRFKSEMESEWTSETARSSSIKRSFESAEGSSGSPGSASDVLRTLFFSRTCLKGNAFLFFGLLVA